MMDEKPYCGAVADIVKLFDQVRRELVIAIAKAAGMPTSILEAYGRFLDSMIVYNCLPEGMGRPWLR